MAQLIKDLYEHELKLVKDTMVKFQSGKSETEIKKFLKKNSVVTNFITKLDANEEGEPSQKVMDNVKIFRTRMPPFVSTSDKETKILCNKWLDLACDMPSNVRKMPIGDDEDTVYQGQIKSVVNSFYDFFEACFDEIKKKGINSTVNYSCRWQGTTTGKKTGTYGKLLKELIACALATIRAVTQDVPMHITRQSLNWPGPIISLEAAQQNAKMVEQNSNVIAKIDASLSHAKSNDKTYRALGLTKSIQLVNDQWQAHVDDVIAKITSTVYETEALTAPNNLNKKLCDKCKQYFIDNCINEFLAALFEESLYEGDVCAISAKLSTLDDYYNTVKSNPNSCDATLLDPIKYMLEQLLNFARNSAKPVTKLQEAFKVMNLESSTAEYVMDQERVFHPPIIQLDTKSMFDPDHWRNTEPLHEFIYGNYLHYCAKARVKTEADQIRGLFYIFQSKRQQMEFDKEVLRNLPAGTQLDRDQMDDWIRMICKVFDAESAKTTAHYRNLFNNHEMMKQKHKLSVS